jgi:EmrB/QacA subfamily drug resistance transporter
MRVVDHTRPLGEVLTSRQKWLLIGSLMLAMFIGALDQTVVSTATPRILADLGGFELISWLFTSYMLTSTVAVPLVGKLSDIYGRKWFILAGIGIFFVSSILCGAAPNIESLIVWRAGQGLGSGIVMAAVFPTLGDIFPPAERGKYMGLFTGVFSLASILGPTLGGFLTDNVGWRWVFFVNIPVCLVAVPAIWFNLPAKKSERRPKIDWVGAALLSVAAVTVLLGLEWAGKRYDWSSPVIVGLFVASFASTLLFLGQERRHPEPILPLFLFKNNVFAVSNLLVFVMGMGMFGALQYLGIFVQTALGASATAAGVIGTPQSLGLLVSSVVAGQLMSRTGRYKFQALIGSVLVLVAMILLRTMDTSVAKLEISAYMVILGLGFGAMMPPLSLAVQNAVSQQHLGVASSANQFFRQIGSVFGIAIFAVILTNSYDASFEKRVTDADRMALGKETVALFGDPTLALNEGLFDRIKAQYGQTPDGAALIDRAVDAQRESVAVAIRDIFTVALAVAALGILLVLFLKEVPLRRDFKTPGAQPTGERGPAAEPVVSAGH